MESSKGFFRDSFLKWVFFGVPGMNCVLSILLLGINGSGRIYVPTKQKSNPTYSKGMIYLPIYS